MEGGHASGDIREAHDHLGQKLHASEEVLPANVTLAPHIRRVHVDQLDGRDGEPAAGEHERLHGEVIEMDLFHGGSRLHLAQAPRVAR